MKTTILFAVLLYLPAFGQEVDENPKWTLSEWEKVPGGAEIWERVMLLNESVAETLITVNVDINGAVAYKVSYQCTTYGALGEEIVIDDAFHEVTWNRGADTGISENCYGKMGVFDTPAEAEAMIGLPSELAAALGLAAN